MTRADDEYRRLLSEMRSKHFSTSAEVSAYIRRNRLGYRYKHITGVLEMTDGESAWDFNGGISPEYYARLCQDLGLNNNGTKSQVVGFTPFAEKWRRKRRY